MWRCSFVYLKTVAAVGFLHQDLAVVGPTSSSSTSVRWRRGYLRQDPASVRLPSTKSSGAVASFTQIRLRRAQAAAMTVERQHPSRWRRQVLTPPHSADAVATSPPGVGVLEFFFSFVPVPHLVPVSCLVLIPYFASTYGFSSKTLSLFGTDKNEHIGNALKVLLALRATGS